MNKLESRLANQCDGDSLIANEAFDMNFTLFKVTGMVSLINGWPLCQNLSIFGIENSFMVHTFSWVFDYFVSFYENDIKLLSKCCVF